MTTNTGALFNSELSGGKRFAAGLLAGAVAGLTMSTVMLLLASALGIATPLAIIGDRLSVFIPADAFLALMGKVGGYNHMKQLGVSSVIAGQIILGALGGALYGMKAPQLSLGGRRRFSIGAFIVLPLVVVGLFLWPVLGTNYWGYPIKNATVITLVGLLVSFIVFERTLVLGFRGLISRPRSLPADVEYTPPIGRRALILGGLGLLAAGGGGAILRKLYRAATFSYDGTQYKGEGVQAITPNEQFYCVTKNVIDPKVQAAVWRLEVTGLVEKPQRYKLDRLKSLPPVTQETTLMCISNGLGAGLISNAVWKGVPMKTLLDAANPLTSAAKVRLHGVDNYTDTISLAKALDPGTLVVYEMNGEPLPDRHGFPARCIVPGYFGEKHVKWVTRIELTGPEAEGFYEKQGWGPDFTVPIRSRIDVPYNEQWFGAPTAAKGIPMKGIAFGGDRGVSRVEVSADDGKTWADAKLDYPGTRLTWALWSYPWQPAKVGDYSLVVRATNADGELQTFDEKRPFKSGTSGFHKVVAHVYAG
ncbi:MAG: molybdopterin-dependent oxidoreductase [Chthoniobacterales bacterium]